MLVSAAGVSAAAPPPTYKSPTGIEFVLIHPGRMQVAVFEPVCPGEKAAAFRPEPGASIDPRILWTSSDLALCRKLAQRDASSGFPVVIEKSFYIGKFEITQEQWVQVTGSNPSTFQGSKVVGDAGRHPVESVSWNDARDFIGRLNRMEQTHAYRLPTEFEWEYAGRAGGPAQIGWNEIRAQAVQGLRAGAEGSKPTTQTVGSKQPNAWGLYDMLGNVWEWVQDYYNAKTFPDPTPPASGTEHVLKGAGFASDVKKQFMQLTPQVREMDGMWDFGL